MSRLEYDIVVKKICQSGFCSLKFRYWNPDVSGFFFSNWKINIRTRCENEFCQSGFIFINEKIKIQTCPHIHFHFENFKFGHVRIFIYQWEISIPDMSEFQLRTRPYFNFSIAKFKIRTRPDFNSGHVRISIFQLQNFKSGRVQILIPDFRFSRGDYGTQSQISACRSELLIEA